MDNKFKLGQQVRVKNKPSLIFAIEEILLLVSDNVAYSSSKISSYFQEHELEECTEPKPKKLVEMKCYLYSDQIVFFSNNPNSTSVEEIPYTIKDGKIFIEVESE